MRYHSTNKQSPLADLPTAILKSLAPDNGLYMPERLPSLPKAFFDSLPERSLVEIGQAVARAFFGQDVPTDKLDEIVEDTLAFDIPLVPLDGHRYALELFHGPTCAFKDVGARFLARLTGFLVERRDAPLYVLAATSGDTGSAVASGFHNVEGIQVVLLYPKGKVSHIQEQQLTTYEGNVTTLEVEGAFDDCQRLVKTAFLDTQLNAEMTLTSANSINWARLLPQSIYYFHALSQLRRAGDDRPAVFSVPSGNFGNLTAGLVAKRVGLPVKRFIAATNANDVVPQYLETGAYAPRPSVRTLANAMDVGAPSNFARMLDLYADSHPGMAADVSGFRLDDAGIRETIKHLSEKHGYLACPHSAIGYEAIAGERLAEGEAGIFLCTAHPAKFAEAIEETLGQPVEIPERLQAFLHKEKRAHPIAADYEAFKAFLLHQAAPAAR